MTAPTCLRSHVERVATSRAMAMKYSSQLARLRSLISPRSGLNIAALDVGTLAWLRCRVNRRKIALAQGAGLCFLAATVTGLALSAPDSKAQASALLAEVAKSPRGADVASE